MIEPVNEETLSKLFDEGQGRMVVARDDKSICMDNSLANRLLAEEAEQQAFVALRTNTGVLPVGMSAAEAAVRLEKISIDRRRQFIESAWKFSELENYHQ